MAEITTEELDKAARNIARISTFIGERRNWTVGDGGEAMAHEIRANARALASVLVRATGMEPNSGIEVILPPELEPSAEISAVRLAKFSTFLSQLRAWFSSQDVGGMPQGSTDAVQAIHDSIAQVTAAVDSLQENTFGTPSSRSRSGALDETALPQPLFEIDTNARLILENSELKPLVRSFEGVTELTHEAKEILEEFLVQQKIEFDPHELRRFQDKLLKWIESTPLNQVLVIKVTGISGRPSLYSSYQPRSGVKMETSEET
jgi:hypothetical protein